MKRVITILAILAAAALTSLGGAVASASAASCGSFAALAPTLNSGIHDSGTNNCSPGQWGESADELLYESGGTWHDATVGGNPVAPRLNGPHAAGLDGWGFVWTGIDQTPYCSYNWKVNLSAVVWSTLAFIPGSSHTSPTLTKTC